MKSLAWLTDIHLNFLSPDAVEAFIGSLADVRADAFFIGGDVGEPPVSQRHLVYGEVGRGRRPAGQVALAGGQLCQHAGVFGSGSGRIPRAKEYLPAAPIR
jgi:hypothetical protein